VTQNVDGLHQRAGTANIIELHGNLSWICRDCRTDHARESVQRTLETQNPAFVRTRATVAPDGDSDVEVRGLETFNVPACPSCGGMLKPDVVFFGENVPRDRVDAAMRALDEADAMLVVGSSLMVYSGFRFCERAGAAGKPIAAINRGRTRADHLFAQGRAVVRRRADRAGGGTRRRVACVTQQVPSGLVRLGRVHLHRRFCGSLRRDPDARRR
jgi:NAD-dependent SIR2 family protein deacetylase